ncbi:probable polygalacturonase At3g15720 [Amaranthus tricolor]|uniref:probable polygalacturonase At3g15720 n=1 Tax=Amaranthus tricolor TaxID=29722 RepID=UPI002587B8EF|nr:probable polygalacturonase At3g15720 [Amaranthus tricolor]
MTKFKSKLVLGIRSHDHGIGLLEASIFNVIDFGAIGDGQHDDNPAFLKAWEAVCGATDETPTLIIPADKTFLLTPISFHGPCKSTSLHVQIEGTLWAPDSRDAWKNCEANSWIVFKDIENLIIDGSGLLNGKGSTWWKVLAIQNCNGLQLKGITNKDSPGPHLAINSCNNSILSNLQIIAPETSENTDGIDISYSTQVQITDSNIGTGDDCIAIGDGTSRINITGIMCGPGHGISIGSLGKNGGMAKVEQIYVRNCTFNGSSNGARIKTWQGGSGYARNISFEDIPLIDVKNPIIIDQYYCFGPGGCPNQKEVISERRLNIMEVVGSYQPWKKENQVMRDEWEVGSIWRLLSWRELWYFEGHLLMGQLRNLENSRKKSAVEIKSVTYKGFHGSSSSMAAITLNCSSSIPCTSILMENINITSSNPSVNQTIAFCENAQGKQDFVSPQVSCLTH